MVETVTRTRFSDTEILAAIWRYRVLVNKDRYGPPSLEELGGFLGAMYQVKGLSKSLLTPRIHKMVEAGWLTALSRSHKGGEGYLAFSLDLTESGRAKVIAEAGNYATDQ